MVLLFEVIAGIVTVPVSPLNDVNSIAELVVKSSIEYLK